MALKVQKKSTSINPFSGICFVNEEFSKIGMNNLINRELGMRGEMTTYSYSDIIRNYSNIFYCGGDCAEDIQANLSNHLKSIPLNKVPSSDTLLRGVKELAVSNEQFTSNSDISYQFNINTKLNLLNIKSLLLTGQLKKGEYYDFDYDNQILATEKYDAKNTYKHIKGYFPGISTIGNSVVYIENRDGNANVKFEQAATLTRSYNLLIENGIKINRSRMDAGSYAKEIIKVVAENSNLFYIRANKSADMLLQVKSITNWKTVEINFKKYEVASIPFVQFFEEKKYRLVVMREKGKSNQTDLFTEDALIYRSILTNDVQSTEKEVIEYYNQRGNNEKVNDVMNNDFGWKNLPCSNMNENTAYLILTAIAKNFYDYFIGKVAIVFPNIEPKSRMKKFIFGFISVAGKWVHTSRQWVLQLFTDRPYEKLLI